MARIQEEVIVITVSKLHKNTSETNVTDSDIVSEDTISALASVAEELLGDGVVVEVSKASIN
jgi:hypothetical protein